MGPVLDLIANAQLIEISSGKEVAGCELWREKPCLIIVFRRTGCILCREEAQNVWNIRKQLSGHGVHVIGILHEIIVDEMKEFNSFWPGTLYHDPNKAFYKALGGGKLISSFWHVFNPYSQVWALKKRARQAVGKGSLRGDLTTMGGIMLVGSDGIKLCHPEAFPGDYMSGEEVMEAVVDVTHKKLAKVPEEP